MKFLKITIFIVRRIYQCREEYNLQDNHLQIQKRHNHHHCPHHIHPSLLLGYCHDLWPEINHIKMEVSPNLIFISFLLFLVKSPMIDEFIYQENL